MAHLPDNSRAQIDSGNYLSPRVSQWVEAHSCICNEANFKISQHSKFIYRSQEGHSELIGDTENNSGYLYNTKTCWEEFFKSFIWVVSKGKKFIESPNMRYNSRRNWKKNSNGNNIPYSKLKILAEEIHTVNNGAIVGIQLLLESWQIEIQVAMYSACRLDFLFLKFLTIILWTWGHWWIKKILPCPWHNSFSFLPVTDWTL